MRACLKGGARKALVLAFMECWWDTTHTFHIASEEMTQTLHDTYHLTGLYYRGPPVKFRGLLDDVRLDEALLGYIF